MRSVLQGQKQFIVLSTGNRPIESTQGLVISDPGHGKSMLLEAYIDRFVEEGGLVFVLFDPKYQKELAYSQFDPSRIKYFHRELLRHYALELTRIKCKVWHPVTTKIPNRKIGETQFYSIPLQSLTTEDIISLLESDEDIGNREILVTAVSKLKENHNLYDLMRFVNHELQRKQIMKGGKTLPAPDPERFGLVGVKGRTTLKDLGKIYSAFERFKTHPFMQPITDPLTLDPRQLFEGEAKIHLFSTEFVREQKTECFIVSKLIDFIVENKQKYFNGKVLVVFDEAPELFGSKQSRLFYKKQLAGKFSKFLRQSARIRGISTLSATHSLSGLNRTLLKDNCFNWLKVGQTSSKYDLEILRDFFGFGMDHMRALQSLQKGVFLGIKIPGVSLQQSSYQGLRTIPARFRHAQEDENYEKEYAKEFKKRMQNYHFIVSLLKDIEKEERKKIEQQIKTMQNKVIKEDEQGGNKE